jgi:hypothetical protein
LENRLQIAGRFQSSSPAFTAHSGYGVCVPFVARQLRSAGISAGPNFKLDLARRPANAGGMKWKANLLFLDFGKAAVWPNHY